MRHLWLVGLAVTVLGCSERASRRCEPIDPGGAPLAAIEIGDSSGDAFVPWTDGDAAVLVNGTQGGWMLVVGLRTGTSLAPGSACATSSLAVPDGLTAPIAPTHRSEQAIVDAGKIETVAYPLLLDFDRDALEGRSIRIDATLEAEGASAAGSVWLDLVVDR